MLSALLPIISLLSSLLPLIGSATAGAPTVASFLTVLEGLVPVAIQAGAALITPIQQLIADLQATGAPTATELAALQAYDAQLDAAFEAAATAAGDPAPAAS